jgi:uncharacterized membrane protein YeiH
MTLLAILDLAGVAVFAVSGALAAGRKSLDLLGVVVIATVTAIGGGTLRDLLLDRPVFWLGDPQYLYVITLSALGTVAYARLARPPEHALQLADALGLALFCVSGAQIAESQGYGAAIVIMMATITCVVSGVLRDVLCAEIPMILRRGQLYATAVIAGAAVYVLLRELALPRPWPTLGGMGTVVSLRLASIYLGLTLPVFSLPDRDDET